MKFRNLLFTGLIGIAAASCSNDVIDPDGNGPTLDRETSTFVKVSIMGDARTRADVFADGSADESKVNRLLLTFFDAAQNYVGKTEVTVGEDEKDIVFNGTGQTVERIVTVVCQVDLPKDINYPKYVIAYVNPTTKAGDLATDKLTDPRNIIRDRTDISPDGRTMNNSVYFDASGNQVFATEVNFDNDFHKTYEEAAAADAAAIEIFVERMEAKVQLNDISGIDVTPVTSTVGADVEYTLTFIPEAWFVNAIEKRSFLLKNYGLERENYTSGNKPDPKNAGYTLTDLNTAFINSDPANKRDNSFSVNDINGNPRSYWAIDPTYFLLDEENMYPAVSYDIKYGVTVPVNPAGKTYPLEYRSYENVLSEYKGGSTNFVKFTGGKKTHEYVTENTMSANTLRSTDAKASMTSVVLLGHYVITDKDNKIVFDGSATPSSSNAFYVHHEADGKKLVMLNDNEVKDYFLERNGNTLFVQERDVDGNVLAGKFIPLSAAVVKNDMYGLSYNDFELVYPDKKIIGKTLSEQWRTLSIKKGDTGYNDNLYVFSDNEYKKVNSLNSTELEGYLKRMYSDAYGVVERFESGKAYFNVPLRHIWADLEATDNSFKPDKVRLGDYGVVRNHVYDLVIESIEGWGTGIGDIKQPIVPPTENEQYYISTRLKILKWHVVGQKVKL